MFGFYTNFKLIFSMIFIITLFNNLKSFLQRTKQRNSRQPTVFVSMFTFERLQGGEEKLYSQENHTNHKVNVYPSCVLVSKLLRFEPVSSRKSRNYTLSQTLLKWKCSFFLKNGFNDYVHIFFLITHFLARMEKFTSSTQWYRKSSKTCFSGKIV